MSAQLTGEMSNLINFPYARVDGACPSGPPMLDPAANKVEGLAYIGQVFIFRISHVPKSFFMTTILTELRRALSDSTLHLE